VTTQQPDLGAHRAAYGDVPLRGELAAPLNARLARTAKREAPRHPAWAPTAKPAKSNAPRPATA
jgi:hypothetical protein